MSDIFRSKAPGIMRELIRDLDIPADGAAAILGNIGQETGGFQFRTEINKQPGDAQGYGWGQWTGSRRTAFEAFASMGGYDLEKSDHYDAACYSFMVHELLQTWEKRALPPLRDPGLSLGDKTLAFRKLYERPGVPHDDRRLAWAVMALAAFKSGGAPAPEKPGPEPAPQPKPVEPAAPLPAPVASGATIPASWMPAARMQRIVVHWTAGGYKASEVDRAHYHILYESDGKIVRGIPTIDKNESPVKPGYAAHSLNTNGGSIGVSMCCMAGAIESPLSVGSSPMTRAQWDAMTSGVAQLCKRYGITPGPKTVLTHAEIQPNLGIVQRGKWDVSILPFDRSFNSPRRVGERMRAEVDAKIKGIAPPRTITAAEQTGATVVIAVGTGGITMAAKPDWTLGEIALVALAATAVIVGGIFLARYVMKKRRRAKEDKAEAEAAVALFQRHAGQDEPEIAPALRPLPSTAPDPEIAPAANVVENNNTLEIDVPDRGGSVVHLPEGGKVRIDQVGPGEPMPAIPPLGRANLDPPAKRKRKPAARKAAKKPAKRPAKKRPTKRRKA